MLLNILLVLTILICVALVFAILLQRSEGGALGMSGGGPGAFMTARGTGDFLSTSTQVLAALFFALCLIMTLISGRSSATSSVVDRLKLQPTPVPGATHPLTPASATPAPATPAPSQAPAPSFNAAPAKPAAAPSGPSADNPFGPNTAAPAKAASH
jgi:preprotein translocase subunit SecG